MKVLLALILVLAGCKHEEPTSNANMSPAERGKQAYQQRGCVACHSLDGSQLIGPSFKGVYLSEVKLADGTQIKADEAYLKESIETPMAKTVRGFSPTMPSFKGQLTDEQIQDLIAFIKSVQ